MKKQQIFISIIVMILSITTNAQNVTIPDVNFKNALLNHIPAIDLNGDNEIQVSEAVAFSGLMQVSGMEISDLTGIEAFTSLDTLWCHYNELTNLDISNNLTLKQLDCNSNQLTSLDVSNNLALKYLVCNDNNITSLDVTNTPLTTLICPNNQLTDLDVSTNVALTKLNCAHNPLSGLDVSNNTALTSLICSSNGLGILDVSNNMALTYLNCVNNQLTNLDVSNNTDLTILWCAINQLTTLDLSNNTALTELICNDNLLTTLNVNDLNLLTLMYCYTNQLSNLDLSTNTALAELRCSSNPLTTLDVQNNTALELLVCSYTQLTTLDVSKNTVLTALFCMNNQLTSLNVANTNNTNFTKLVAVYNPNLECIKVDDAAYSIANWVAGADFAFDAGVSFSEDCGSISTPTTLTATASISSLSVVLNWSDNSTNETGYKVERSTDGTNFTEIADLTANSTTTTDNNVTELTTYYYRVYAYNSSLVSDFSNVAEVTTGTIGVNEIVNTISAVYPNPADKFVIIDNLTNNAQITLSDIAGKVIYTTVANQSQEIINISQLTGGIYLLHIFTESGKLTRQVVKK